MSSEHRHPIFARVYPHISRAAEQRGAAEHRRALLAGLQDRVIEVRTATAEALPAQDGEFDAAVASLVLCSVSDQDAVLREIARVLRSGGELRFYEHVISHRPATARVQPALDATIYSAAGRRLPLRVRHPHRDPQRRLHDRPRGADRVQSEPDHAIDPAHPPNRTTSPRMSVPHPRHVRRSTAGPRAARAPV